MNSTSGAAPSAKRPSFLFKPASILERLDFAALFPRAQPVEVELGSGDGSFLAQWAALHPERNFIGVERLLGRVRKLDRKSFRAGLTNLRIVKIEAAYLVEFLLPPASVSALHIYFPDPWPKRKHRKNRLVNGPFTEKVVVALAPGGIVWLRTDDADYFAQMLAVFHANAAFEAIETPPELAAVVTDFERVFNTTGIATLRCAWRKR
ncbi:MAG: tRNA (guanosine(46)-N7)-methyltransferase TrmB [Verrucomicrobia bacterium]|nr:tRNA (guanosine(46)-N7)-methyltransferase TrmB [Verrucomicrobiota bacterium]